VIPEAVHPARWWHLREDGRLECDLCPRRCRLKKGQRGFCFVRSRAGDEMVLTTYGRSSGFCIDPVEKKPLNHFLPGTPVLSFGTAGCNLGCRFCQNWNISKSRETDRLADAASPRKIARTARQSGCGSVAFTYNDPVIFAEYAIDTAEACRREGVRTIAVTAGYICPEARAEFFAPIDAANVDLKAFHEDFYREVCLGRLEDVKATLLWLKHESSVWFEITTLLIPGLNDSDAEVRRQCEWIRSELGPDVPVHFSAFHPDFRMLDRAPTPPATLFRARRTALRCGLHYVYTGNVFDPDGQSTRCPSCGKLLVRRDGYEILSFELDARGTCPGCGRPIPGVFENRPGNWGSRRQPVRLSAGS